MNQVRQEYPGDLFNRRQVADRLEVYARKIGHGVVCIDAKWGEGKSYFIKHWSNTLTNRPCILIDAFRYDHIDDPFMMITSKILESIDNANPLDKKLKAKATKVLKAIIPFTTKLLINSGGKLLLGQADLVEKVSDALGDALEDTGDETEKFLAEQIEIYEEENKSVQHFKEVLIEFTKQFNEPVLIMVDELDRCKPTFAVSLLERLKHFFDVPNLVFILALNREQMERSVNGIYGDQIDSATYLNKFIDITVKLPKFRHGKAALDYGKKLAKEIGYDSDEISGAFPGALKFVSRAFDLSLRDMERVMIHLKLQSDLNYGLIKIFLISLKIKKPDIFELLRHDRNSAHKEVYDWLVSLDFHSMDDKFENDYFEYLKILFRYLQFFPNDPDQRTQAVFSYFDLGMSKAHGNFIVACNHVEMP